MPLSFSDYLGKSLPAIVFNVGEMQHAASKRLSEDRSNKFRETARDLIDGAARLVTAAKADPEADLAQLSDELLKFEREQSAGLPDYRAWRKQVPSVPKSAAPQLAGELAALRQERAALLAAIDETIDLVSAVAEAARDARWQLAALRSERENQGGGPMLQTVEDFDRLYVRR